MRNFIVNSTGRRASLIFHAFLVVVKIRPATDLGSSLLDIMGFTSRDSSRIGLMGFCKFYFLMDFTNAPNDKIKNNQFTIDKLERIIYVFIEILEGYL